MATVFPLDAAKRLDLPGRTSREVVSGRDGAQAVTLRHVVIEPEDGGSPKRGPHVHDGFEECIVVVSGEGLMVAGGREQPVRAGDTVLVPSGERHQTRNVGAVPLVLLCFFPVTDVGSRTREFPPVPEGSSAP